MKRSANKVQRAYMIAKARVQEIESQQEDIERKYIADNLSLIHIFRLPALSIPVQFYAAPRVCCSKSICGVFQPKIFRG